MLALLEAAKLVTNPLARGVIELFPRTSPVLERLPFLPVSGNAYRYIREETLPGIGFRGINESYTESTGVLNPQIESLFTLGGISKVDRVLVKTQGNQNNLRAQYDGMKAKAAALEFTKMFFKGDNSTNHREFDGLEKRLTGDQLITRENPSSGGDPLTSDLLNELIDAVQGGPDVLFMNKTTRRYMNKVIRSEDQAMEVVTDVFGRQLQSYAGIPIGVIEDDKDGNPILPFTEDNPGGGAAASTSVYAVRFGVGEWVSGLQNGSLEVIDQGLSGTHYQTLIEWICGLGIFHPKAAARLQGIEKL